MTKTNANDARVRLWVECDLKPILSIDVADDEDISITAAKILQKRYAERIANAIADVLNADEDADWHNKTFQMSVSFHKTVIRPFLKHKLTLHERFTRLQAKLCTEDGYRLVKRKTAKRFCRLYHARIVLRGKDDQHLPGDRLILDFDHPDIGKGEQLIAFVAEV